MYASTFRFSTLSLACLAASALAVEPDSYQALITNTSGTQLTASPGGSRESQLVSSPCPTFSWGAVEDAQSYELAVFDQEFSGPNSKPVLSASIATPALSWTPATDQCLQTGRRYVWSVRAETAEGVGNWSEARHFEISLDNPELTDAVQREVQLQLNQPATWRQMIRDAMRSEGLTIRQERSLTTHSSTENQTAENNQHERGLLTQAASFYNIAFRVSNKNGVVFDDAGDNTGLIPAEGQGARLMWYPAKRALRAGYDAGTYWNTINIGTSSVAIGSSTLASGSASAAFGAYTQATGGSSTAMGINTLASGESSTAMGNFSRATGNNSTAMGYNSEASGDASIAMGDGTTASGLYSTAMGRDTTASGTYSLAAGRRAKTESPSGLSKYSGSFVWADSFDFDFHATAGNQFSARASGGVRFVTDIDGSGNATETFTIDASGNVSATGTMTASSTTLPGVTPSYHGITAMIGDRIAAYGVNSSSSWPAMEAWNQGSGDLFRAWAGANGSQQKKFSVTNDGTVFATAYNTPSDGRLKDNITSLGNALEKISALRGVSYTMKNDPEHAQHIGVIAQELEQQYPELVHTDDQGMKSVAYANLSAVLIEAVKEQQQQIQQQSAQIEALQAQVQHFETQLVRVREQLEPSNSRLILARH